MNFGETRARAKKQKVAAMDVQREDWKGTNVQWLVRGTVNCGRSQAKVVCLSFISVGLLFLFPA